jgi:SMC interacting uncharacterized protein involved in chromosome segregation
MTAEKMAEKTAGKLVEKAPSWIERILLPSLNEIKGEIRAVNTRIDSLDDRMSTKIDSLKTEMISKFQSVDHKFEATDIKIDSLKTEMNSKFEATDIKIDSLKTEMTVRLDYLEKRIPVIEEITALKIKIAELEKKLAAA